MDPDAFYKLALTEMEAVHRLAFHLSRDRHEADDLVQETYLRAVRSMESFQPGVFGVRPWLFKILHNVLHTRRARDRRRRDVLKNYASLSTEQNDGATGSPAMRDTTATGPDAVDWTSNGLDARLLKAIQALPVTHRTVFLLSAVEELKYREIAEIVGVPVGTVMSRLSRARIALAAQLVEMASENNLRRRSSRFQQQPTPRI